MPASSTCNGQGKGKGKGKVEGYLTTCYKDTERGKL